MKDIRKNADTVKPHVNRREFIEKTGALLSVSVLSGCFGLMKGSDKAKMEVDTNLSILLSDIHLQTNPNRGYHFTAREFPRRVLEILSLDPRPARVIVFGDLVFDHGETESYAFLREQIRPLREAGIDVYLGMGNHDRRKNFLAAFPEVGACQPVAGRIVYRIDLGTCDLILLDSLDGREQSVGGEIGDAQTAWLDRELKAARRPVILGAHHPTEDVVFGRETPLAFMRRHQKVVGWICGHGHHWHKNNLCWGEDANEDVIRSLMLPTGCAWGEIGMAFLRSYQDRVVVTLKMIDMVWHDALNSGETRPKVFDAIVKDTDGDTITFPFERLLMRSLRGVGG